MAVPYPHCGNPLPLILNTPKPLTFKMTSLKNNNTYIYIYICVCISIYIHSLKGNVGYSGEGISSQKDVTWTVFLGCRLLTAMFNPSDDALPRGSNVVPFSLWPIFFLGIIIYYPKRNYIRASGY